MYRLIMVGLMSVCAGILYSQEVNEPDYHRPPAADGLTIETRATSSGFHDGPSPLTSPPLTVPLTADPMGHSPLFPGTPTTSDELDRLITPLAPSGAPPLMQERLQLSGFSQKQRRRVCTRKYCYMLGSCVGVLSFGAIIFIMDRYTTLFR